MPGGGVEPPGRIIPARAGFTPQRRRRRRPSADHPRSRGVYSAPHAYEWARPGSSPLARGLPGLAGGLVVGRGIIPARAGFTVLSAQDSGVGEDHPRSRGVYMVAPPHDGARGGSSPLARGLLPDGGAVVGLEGIIPARAGFTPRLTMRAPSPRDHPRSRGVYPPLDERLHRGAGSSPLARGLRIQRRQGSPQRRIIPARAGFTRGVKKKALNPGGSSPLARGLPRPP